MTSTAMMTCNEPICNNDNYNELGKMKIADDKRKRLTITHNDFYKWILEKNTENAKRWNELDLTTVDEYISIDYEWCPDEKSIVFIIAYGENDEFCVKKTYDTNSVFALWLSIVVGFAEEYVE
jgi:hypothetical protein